MFIIDTYVFFLVMSDLLPLDTVSCYHRKYHKNLSTILHVSKIFLGFSDTLYCSDVSNIPMFFFNRTPYLDAVSLNARIQLFLCFTLTPSPPFKHLI